MNNKRFEISTKDADAGGRCRLLGESPARLLYAAAATCGPSLGSAPHTHNCVEFLYMVSGVGQFRMGENLFAVSKGDFVIVHPQVEHAGKNLSAHPLEYIILGVEGLLFPPGIENLYGVYHFHGGQESVRRILQLILRELEDRPAGYIQMCQAFLEMLLILLGRYTDFASSFEPTRRVGRECAVVKRYLDANFTKNISLDQLAELAHVNKYYLVHSFSREYHISPISYLIRRRVKESCRLLIDSDYSLAQISRLLGFSSPSYFSQSFRKLMGMSPMEYRKHSRGMPRRQT